MTASNKAIVSNGVGHSEALNHVVPPIIIEKGEEEEEEDEKK